MSSLLGSLLLVIGLTASIPAVPASFAVVSFVLGWMTTEPSDPDPWPSADVPVREIILAWAVTMPLAIRRGADRSAPASTSSDDGPVSSQVRL